MCNEQDPADLEEAFVNLMYQEQEREIQEQEKEIAKISFLQGLSIGLIAILLEKGLFAPEDIQRWEELSSKATDALKSIFKHGDSLQKGDFATEIEMVKAEIAFLKSNIALSFLLERDITHRQGLKQQLKYNLDRLAELEHEPKTD